MLTATDLDAPALLQYWETDLSDTNAAEDWSHARRFATLREAIGIALSAEPPAGKEPYLLADSGFILSPDMIREVQAGFSAA